jgi:hypothetical protein
VRSQCVCSPEVSSGVERNVLILENQGKCEKLVGRTFLLYCSSHGRGGSGIFPPPMDFFWGGGERMETEEKNKIQQTFLPLLNTLRGTVKIV